jgi:wyosine [tRNA(Phe)-imidazoG37] synthetase (radical SAM superfamily)
MMLRSYTYGPFQSRRLGLSLGINILPRYKICTFNCVYCEIGSTDKENLVSPLFKIKCPPKMSFRKELRSFLKYFPHLNSISFAGYYGEPTLNENLTEFLDIALDVRNEITWPLKKPKITLFTNSSTLHYREIREKVKKFDFILAKLDAATEIDFKRTNCPHEEVPSINLIVDSIAKLKSELPKENKLALQCLIYNSYRNDFLSNNNQENITQLANAIKKIKPDCVQIYSIARIPANWFVFSIDEDQKKNIVQQLRDSIKNDKIEIHYY